MALHCGVSSDEQSCLYGLSYDYDMVRQQLFEGLVMFGMDSIRIYGCFNMDFQCSAMV